MYILSHNLMIIVIHLTQGDETAILYCALLTSDRRRNRLIDFCPKRTNQHVSIRYTIFSYLYFGFTAILVGNTNMIGNISIQYCMFI